LTTTEADKAYIYDLGTETLAFDIFFTSKIDNGTQVVNFCGSKSVQILSNIDASSFLLSTYDSNQNIITVSISSSSAADLGDYNLQL